MLEELEESGGVTYAEKDDEDPDIGGGDSNSAGGGGSSIDLDDDEDTDSEMDDGLNDPDSFSIHTESERSADEDDDLNDGADDDHDDGADDNHNDGADDDHVVSDAVMSDADSAIGWDESIVEKRAAQTALEGHEDVPDVHKDNGFKETTAMNQGSASFPTSEDDDEASEDDDEASEDDDEASEDDDEASEDDDEASEDDDEASEDDDEASEDDDEASEDDDEASEDDDEASEDDDEASEDDDEASEDDDEASEDDDEDAEYNDSKPLPKDGGSGSDSDESDDEGEEDDPAPIQRLSNEILTKIMLRLYPPTAVCLGLSCKQFYKVVPAACQTSFRRICPESRSENNLPTLLQPYHPTTEEKITSQYALTAFRLIDELREDMQDMSKYLVSPDYISLVGRLWKTDFFDDIEVCEVAMGIEFVLCGI